jgi:uncharacterized membrane protein
VVGEEVLIAVAARKIARSLGEMIGSVAVCGRTSTDKVSAITTILTIIALIQEGRAMAEKDTGRLAEMTIAEGRRLAGKITDGGMVTGVPRGDLKKVAHHSLRRS